MERKMEIGKRIATLRRETKHTQKELAEYLNVTDKAVSRWESGVGNPDIDYLPKICEFFGVTLDYLLLGKKDDPKPVEEVPPPLAVQETLDPPKKRLTKKAKIIIISAIAGTLILGGTITGIVLGVKEANNSANYQAAIRLMEAGQYEESIGQWEKLGNYKDSPSKIEVCRGLISIDNSKSYHDYSLLKEGVHKIYTVGESLDVTYNGKDHEIKEELTTFTDVISLNNPGLFEPSDASFAEWEVVNSFYLNSITTLYLKAKWLN